MEANEELLRKSIRINRMKITTDIIGIIILIAILSYAYLEIENFKTLGQDVCRLCEQKTGGTCVRVFGNTSSKVEFPELNYSKFQDIIVDDESEQ